VHNTYAYYEKRENIRKKFTLMDYINKKEAFFNGLPLCG